MDYFLSQLQIVLPVLGVKAICVHETRAPVGEQSENASPVFRLTHAKHGIDVRAQQIDGEFTLLTGSIVAAAVRHSDNYRESTARAYASYRALQERLVADGSIRIGDGHSTVTRDIVFTSPSTAGVIVMGRSFNGRDAWVSSEGTFGQWESRGVDN